MLCGNTNIYLLALCVVQRPLSRVRFFKKRGLVAKIIVDVDGVVANLLPAWLGAYNEDYGDSLSPSDVRSWNTSEYVKEECGDKIFDYLYDGDLYENVDPIPGALEGVKELSDLGHEITFATSCVNESMASAKVRWLQEHGFMDYAGAVIIILNQDKSWVQGDFLVDDYYKNIDGFSGQGLLFTHPHNEELSGGYSRVRDWPGVVAKIASRTHTPPVRGRPVTLDNL